MNLKIKELEFDLNDNDSGYLTHSIHPFPAKFPPQLPKTILEKYAKQSFVVLDPFCGSGTTGVVSKRLGRQFIGCELNPVFFKMATQRFNNQI